MLSTKLTKTNVSKIVARATQDFCLVHPESFDKNFIDIYAELAGEQLHLSEKTSKEKIKKAVIQTIRSFCKKYPEAFHSRCTESLAKRISGQLYTHFIYNPKYNGKDN